MIQILLIALIYLIKIRFKMILWKVILCREAAA